MFFIFLLILPELRTQKAINPESMREFQGPIID